LPRRPLITEISEAYCGWILNPRGQSALLALSPRFIDVLGVGFYLTGFALWCSAACATATVESTFSLALGCLSDFDSDIKWY
jgi:hypothetical protein